MRTLRGRYDRESAKHPRQQQPLATTVIIRLLPASTALLLHQPRDRGERDRHPNFANAWPLGYAGDAGHGALNSAR
jgi:hypothetical protein